MAALRIPIAHQQLQHSGLAPAGRALDTEDAVLRHIEREVGENRLAPLPRVREGDAIKAHALIIRVRSASFHHGRRFVHQAEQTTGGGEGLGEVRGQGGERQRRPERAGEQREGGDQRRDIVEVHAGKIDGDAGSRRGKQCNQQSADTGEPAVDTAEFGMVTP